MDVIRRWIFRPKQSDTSLLAQFFYADRDLNLITDQLEKFDGHKNVEQFPTLLTELRKSQDSLLSIVEKIMDESIPGSRSSRDFRVKFPDDILQESLAGRLWFGAECLAAGSSIINHEIESMSMQPLAKLVTRQLGRVRTLLREQSLRSTNEYSEEICDVLKEFDNTFAEFELCYVSAMVPVKTMKDYDLLQDVTVLFNETVQRALRLGWLSQDQLDAYDPVLMFTIPRMAVICGLLIYPEGPLNPDMSPSNMSEMFRPFQLLLRRIRDLLWTLDMRELWILEMLLSKGKDPSDLDDLTSFDDLGCSSCPWMDEMYDCGAISKRARKGGTCNTVTASTFAVRDSSATTEAGEFVEEVAQPCGCEEQQCLGDGSFESGLMKINGHAESAIRTTSPCSFFLNPSADTNDSKIVTSNVASYDASYRLCSADPAVLSSQIADAICMPDYSLVQRISCGCQETNQFLAPSLQNSCCHILLSVPVKPSVTDDGDEQLAESSSNDRKQFDSEIHRESDSAGVSVYDSLEMSDSSAQREIASFGYDWDRESYSNLVSNSNSLCCDDNDEEAMKLAIEAAETSAREEMRSQFRDSMDLIHRLFICISGIADQLQTNFASDLRHILKTVFNCHTLPSESAMAASTKSITIGDVNVHSSASDASDSVARVGNNESVDRPRWIPDDESPFCTSCQSTFTFMRRRHHCRNCGGVFCGKCSSNTVPLPQYGHEKPVRVCNHCFLFCVTHFALT